ncbi:fusaric acid resistance family protein [Paucimonas lemoignei]|uniref:Fusaric acid resistance family protein n=1 Tax=Paucimonas lemoignei TaxID=29443 RepID=A0A4R3HYT1_PAULE|nr:FUSC family protein [Paucimonas lemoignei]TCS38382.1 fusaric acid resistance family protein [Paucimonas lemoignei]
MSIDKKNTAHSSESALSRFSRGTVTRQLFTPEQIQESMALTRPPSIKIASIAGLQAALALLAAIVLTYFSPWTHMIGYPALGALASLFGRYAPVRDRMRIVAICALLLTLAVLIPSLASLAGASATIMVMVLALLAGASTFAVNHLRLGGPGAVIIVFAVGGALAPVESWQAATERAIATAAGGIVAWIVCALTDHMRTVELASLDMPAPPHRSLSHELIAAGRITLGAGIAAFIAHAAGWPHPAWAAIGATAVMQGGHLHVTMNRALQRMAGTIVGAFIVWSILSQSPSFWMLVAAVVIFQFLTEVIIGFNYALGQITVTPMALLMTYLVAPAPTATNMPFERVLDTILGAAIGIVFAVIFSTVDDRAFLAAHRKKP